MPEVYQIQKMEENDIPAIVSLVNSAYRGEVARKGWTHEADLLTGGRIDEAAVKDLMKNAAVTILKYTADNKITGCVCLEKDGDLLHLGMLTVFPGTQNQGIGKQLLAAAEKLALQFGCKIIEMQVITTRLELIQWYERRGYVRTGVLQPFPYNDDRFGIPLTTLEFMVLRKTLL